MAGKVVRKRSTPKRRSAPAAPAKRNTTPNQNVKKKSK